MNWFLSFYNTIQKRRITTYLSLLLVSVFVSGCLVGCGSNGEVVPINDTEVDLTPTDQLVLELPNYRYLSRVYALAIASFRLNNPGVDVNVTYIGEEDDELMSQYQQAISTGIMAGAGPDVILTDYFPDLYKTMDSGAFVNLNSIISGDTDFNMDDYKTAVMKAGYYKGGQYIMPVGYNLPSLLMGESRALDNVGFRTSETMDVISFLNEVGAVIPTLEADPSFRRVVNYSMSRSSNVFGTHLLTASGIPLVDYETKTGLPDEEALRTFCEAYQPFYAMDISTKRGNSSIVDDMMNGHMLFVRPLTISSFLYSPYFCRMEGGSYIDTPIRSVDEGLVASVEHGLAINANSKNQLNAWNFIKIMLSEDIQTEAMAWANFGDFDGYVVNNAAFEACIWRQPELSTDDFYVPEEYQAEYLKIFNSITDCVLPNTALTDMFYASMESYFMGEQSLDSCVSKLKSSLKVYATE